MKKFFLLLMLLLSVQSQAQENLGNYDEWARLHALYVDALVKIDPTFERPSREVSRSEFDALQRNVALREKYVNFMNDIEEQCVSHAALPECQRLEGATKNYDINACLGNFEYTFYNESLERLNDEVAMVYLAAYSRGTSAADFKSYSDSRGVANMIARLRANLTKNCTASGCSGKRKAGSKGKCFRYVKWGWIGGGFTRSYPGTRHARDAGGDLRRMGFKNLLADNRYKNLTARDAPKGAVLVYSGGPSGHVEVKAGDNEFLSDFKSARPVNEYLSRRLIGIYVK